MEKSHKGWGVGVHKYERKLNPKWSEIVGDFFSGYVSHQDQVIMKPENAYRVYGSDFCPNSILCYDDIEKPIAVSLKDAEKIVNLENKHKNLNIFVVKQNRFN